MPYIVLFLRTGNSAGSIMAEAILDSKGAPDFRAYSAASLPTGSVRTEAINLIQQARLPIDGLRSKSWNEIARPGAPKPDFVFLSVTRLLKKCAGYGRVNRRRRIGEYPILLP